MRPVRILLLAVLGLAACSPGRHDPGGDDTTGADAPSGSGSASEASLVYAHSGSVLYRVDSISLSVVEIGAMTGLGGQSLTDLAVDKSGNMVGITLDKLYSIDPTTAAVTLIKDLSQDASGFTSLSYIPTDLSDPSSADILVSANDQGDVYQIDPSAGTATKIGSYGTVAAGKVVSSGDLIGVRGLGIYATVDVGSQTNDYLAEIDPTTWAATPLGTGTGFDHIFGLAFWAGTIYGFVDDGTGQGKMITIDKTTGVATQINTGTQEWFGAGVTTDAPVIE